MRFLFLLFFLFVFSGAKEFDVDDIMTEKIESVEEPPFMYPYHLTFFFTSEGAPSAADESNKVMYNIPSFYVGFEKERDSYIYQVYGGLGYGVSQRTIFIGADQDKIKAYTINIGISVRKYYSSVDGNGWYPLVGLNHKSAREFHHGIKPDGSEFLQKYRYSFFSPFLGVGYTFGFESLHIKSSIEVKRFFKNRDFRNLGVFVKLEIGY